MNDSQCPYIGETEIIYYEENRMPEIIVFLGGTCAGSAWRDRLISMLTINYFNPVVRDWTEECMAEERRQREECSYCLYFITPLMTGVYSIAEVIDDSNKHPEKTLFCYQEFEEGNNLLQFSAAQLKSLHQVGRMVERNGGRYFTNMKNVAEFLNNA
jgi:hypothetical protein